MIIYPDIYKSHTHICHVIYTCIYVYYNIVCAYIYICIYTPLYSTSFYYIHIYIDIYIYSSCFHQAVLYLSDQRTLLPHDPRGAWQAWMNLLGVWWWRWWTCRWAEGRTVPSLHVLQLNGFRNFFNWLMSDIWISDICFPRMWPLKEFAWWWHLFIRK